jgi:hypothetical protein
VRLALLSMATKIQVMSKLIFNKTFFQPAEYTSLKEFYANVVAKKAENIVLKKKIGSLKKHFPVILYLFRLPSS